MLNTCPLRTQVSITLKTNTDECLNFWSFVYKIGWIDLILLQRVILGASVLSLTHVSTDPNLYFILYKDNIKFEIGFNHI